MTEPLHIHVTPAVSSRLYPPQHVPFAYPVSTWLSETLYPLLVSSWTVRSRLTLLKKGSASIALRPFQGATIT